MFTQDLDGPLPGLAVVSLAEHAESLRICLHIVCGHTLLTNIPPPLPSLARVQSTLVLRALLGHTLL
jgi:hypothetical protein